MSLAMLALIMAAGLAGPLLAVPARWGVPVLVGELALGVLIGRTGLNWVDPDQPVLGFLANAGFALMMLVAGSHVPLRDRSLLVALRRGTLLAVITGVLAIPAGIGVAAVAGTGHAALYAVILASSSAALVMPVVDSAGLAGSAVTALIVHVAIADTACIVLLPLVTEPGRAGPAALGALAVLGGGVVVWLVMALFGRSGVLPKLQRLSLRRHFGLELRWNLIIVFALAGLAQWLGVSVMLAGFTAGLVLAASGEPRRLATQLFAVSDGFLTPVFFVWLGASLDLRSLGAHPVMFWCAGLMAAATVVIHCGARVLGQPLPLAILAGAQLGVPIAAVTIGTEHHLLAPGEGGALLAAALITIGVTSAAASLAKKTVGAPPVSAPPSGTSGDSGGTVC